MQLRQDYSEKNLCKMNWSELRILNKAKGIYYIYFFEAKPIETTTTFKVEKLSLSIVPSSPQAY